MLVDTADLPFLEFPEVAHVGSFDPTEKRNGSYEGRCLSVSLVPASWAAIAKLGHEGVVLTGRGRFVDVLSLTADQKDAVVQWAVDHGLLALKQVVRLHYLDGETDGWHYFDCADQDEAVAESEDMEDGDYRFETLSVHLATEQLAQMSGHSCGQMDSSLSFDVALIQFASRDRSIDGLWWGETFEPDTLSAPRGGVFPGRVSDFSVKTASWEELEELEERYRRKDMGPPQVSHNCGMK